MQWEFRSLAWVPQTEGPIRARRGPCPQFRHLTQHISPQGTVVLLLDNFRTWLLDLTEGETLLDKQREMWAPLSLLLPGSFKRIITVCGIETALASNRVKGDDGKRLVLSLVICLLVSTLVKPLTPNLVNTGFYSTLWFTCHQYQLSKQIQTASLWSYSCSYHNAIREGVRICGCSAFVHPLIQPQTRRFKI